MGYFRLTEGVFCVRTYTYTLFMLLKSVNCRFISRLWSIHTGPPKRVEDMDPNTREYWYKLRRENLIQRNLARKGVKFYTTPPSHELKFSSRIQPKRKAPGKS